MTANAAEAARALHTIITRPCAGCPTHCDTIGSGHLSESCCVATAVRLLREVAK